MQPPQIVLLIYSTTCLVILGWLNSVPSPPDCCRATQIQYLWHCSFQLQKYMKPLAILTRRQRKTNNRNGESCKREYQRCVQKNGLGGMYELIVEKCEEDLIFDEMLGKCVKLEEVDSKVSCFPEASAMIGLEVTNETEPSVTSEPLASPELMNKNETYFGSVRSLQYLLDWMQQIDSQRPITHPPLVKHYNNASSSDNDNGEWGNVKLNESTTFNPHLPSEEIAMIRSTKTLVVEIDGSSNSSKTRAIVMERRRRRRRR